ENQSTCPPGGPASFSSHPPSPAYRSRPKHKRLLQHRTGAIPGSLLQKELKRFKASPPVLETQELAGERSLPTRLPASTPVLAPERYCSIRLTQIRQLAL